MSRPTVRFQRLPHNTDLPLPAYQTEGSAGMDLRAALGEELVLQPLQRVAVPTGLRIELPHGYEGQVRARSGLAYKKGLAVINGPGTIDWDYRGELKVLLTNLDPEPQTIAPGERIAQLVVVPVVQAEVVEVAEITSTTERGAGGFGSTGTR
ncbi:MAG: dUTP diphosphatase [Myxococcota bacterium]|nr:dUTP diphosphatase [Myxococcota bacterium]